jgi:hypothetical protein
MGTLRRSGNAYSHSTERYYATSVSNVPQDVSDEDALTGSWRKRITPPKSTQDLEMDQVWALRRAFAGKLWLTQRLELDVDYKQKLLREKKLEILHDVETIDNEIIDYAINMSRETHDIRKAPELVDRWVKEAAATREVEGESQGATTAPTAAPSKS